MDCAFAATELDSIQEKMCLAPSILILRLSDKYRISSICCRTQIAAALKLLPHPKGCE